jgi:hypothetical protein
MRKIFKIMIYIFHHIWPSSAGIKIAKEQKNRIYNKINDEFIYIKSQVLQSQNELTTLKLLQSKVKSFDDNDTILYIHTKGASDTRIGKTEWREVMETEVIDNYKFHLKILKNGFNTSGCLMGIPFWSEYIYGGNFWWAAANYLKTIKHKISDNGNRMLAEWNFISEGINWNPYNIPHINLEKYNHFANLICEEICKNSNFFNSKKEKSFI